MGRKGQDILIPVPILMVIIVEAEKLRPGEKRVYEEKLENRQRNSGTYGRE